MELTKEEQKEANKFKKEHPTMYKLLQATIKKIKDNESHITALDKRTDSQDKELMSLKAELTKHQKTVGLHSDKI